MRNLAEGIIGSRQQGVRDKVFQSIETDLQNGTPVQQALFNAIKANPAILSDPTLAQSFKNVNAFMTALHPKLSRGEKLLDMQHLDAQGHPTVLFSNDELPASAVLAQQLYPNDPDAQRRFIIAHESKAPEVREFAVGDKKITKQWVPDPSQPAGGKWVDQAVAPLYAPTELQRNAALAFPNDPQAQHAAIQRALAGKGALEQAMSARDAALAAGNAKDAATYQKFIDKYASQGGTLGILQQAGVSLSGFTPSTTSTTNATPAPTPAPAPAPGPQASAAPPSASQDQAGKDLPIQDPVGDAVKTVMGGGKLTPDQWNGFTPEQQAAITAQIEAARNAPAPGQ